MDQSHLARKAGDEPADSLWCDGYFRDEDDGLLSLAECFCHHCHVDFRFPGTGHTLEQESPSGAVLFESALQPVPYLLLVRREQRAGGGDKIQGFKRVPPEF